MASTTKEIRKTIPIRNAKVTRSYLSHELAYGNGQKEKARLFTVRLTYDQTMEIRKTCANLMKEQGVAVQKDTHLLSFRPAKTYANRDTKELTPVLGTDGKPMFDLTLKVKGFTDRSGADVSASEAVKRVEFYNGDNTRTSLENEQGGEISGYTVDVNISAKMYSSPKKDGSGEVEYGVTAYVNQIRITNRPVRGFMEFEGVDDLSHGFVENADEDIAPAEEISDDVPELDLPFAIED